MHLKKWIKARIIKALALRDLEMTAAPMSLDEEQFLIGNNYVTAEEIVRLKAGLHSTSCFLGRPIGITDSFWYLHSLKEIFSEEVYRFRASTKTPYILDCGSNVGLSVLYFKRLFPDARIVAFEPDTHICGLLKANLNVFGHGDVVVENKAVWREESVLSFAATGSLGGRLSAENATLDSETKLIKVPTVRLRNYLNEKTDFLKIDIEGPEVEVLEDCREQLANVENLFVEYHSDPETEQQLDLLLSILKGAGFRIYIKEAWNNLPIPFLRDDYKPCYDLQLNVFAYRTKKPGIC